MKLSILICSLPERTAYLNRLRCALDPQMIAGVTEIIVDDRPRGLTTGEKRNDMIANSTGEYFCFVDDDDFVPPYYVESIIAAMAESPDVITFKGWMTTNGLSRVDWIIKLGERYEARKDADNITRYYRFPNHLCPMRRDRVGHIRFPHVTQGEDYAFALEIHQKGLLKTEVHIDKQLYVYEFRTNK